MARNGSGTYALPAGNPVVTGTTISSSTHNTTMTDIAAELTNSVDKDGQTVYTGTQDYNGNKLILDADADTSITSDTDDIIDFEVKGVDAVKMGWQAVADTGFLTLDPAAFTADTTENTHRVAVNASNAITIPAGTTALASSLYVVEPNLTATGTITTASTVYIKDAPTEGATNWALWVDAGNVKFDEALTVTGAVTGGTIDGSIGSVTPAAIIGTTLKANTSLELASGATVTAILDEDAMGTNSATALATQQSIKKYVDDQIVAPGYVDTSGTVSANDFAKFSDADTVVGRSYAETKTDLSLNNVENTAVSTWAGSANITTLGTIGTGVWQGDVIDAAYVPSSGSMVWLANFTPSATASLDIDNTYFDGTYDEYLIKFWDLLPATDTDALWVRTSTNNGSSFDTTSAYDYASRVIYSSAVSSSAAGADQILVSRTVGNAANELGANGSILVIRPDTAAYTRIEYDTNYTTGTGTTERQVGAGTRLAAADVDAVQLKFSTNDITSGLVSIYGIKRT